jgi:hypothetical protein
MVKQISKITDAIDIPTGRSFLPPYGRYVIQQFRRLSLAGDGFEQTL